MRNRSSSSRPGHTIAAYTLVELLVTISIIILLIALLLPSLSRAREQARSAMCLSNLHQLGIGTAAYQNANKEWLPISPAEKIYRHLDDEGRRVEQVITTCHWGGSRAEWVHTGPPELPSPVETELRPLTQTIYPNADLDSPTPVFRCPSDRPTDWSDSLIPGGNINRTCGNSYYINMFGELKFPTITYEESPAKSMLYMEGQLYFLMALEISGNGWHRRPSQHNILFLDMHAADTHVDSTKRSGKGWSAADFLSMSEYYSTK